MRLFGAVFIAIQLIAGAAVAGDKIEVRIFAPTGSPEPKIRCTARISNDDTGTDLVRMLCENMTPRMVYTLFLGQSATPGAIPVSFVGQFKANRQGTARLVAELEILNAFMGLNPSMDPGNGIVDVKGAGALANGGLTVSLDYFRIYQAMPAPAGNPTVFGLAPDQVGGSLVATSDRIPDQAP